MSEEDGSLPVASAATVRGWARSSARRHRPGLTAVLGLQGAASAAGLLFPHELGVMVAAVAGPHGAHTVRTAAAVLAVSLVVQAVLARMSSRRAAVLGETVLAELREDFVDRVLDLPLGVVERAGTGELLTRATSDVESLSYAIRYAIPQLLIAAVQALLTAAALVVTAPVLGVVLVPAIVVVSIGLRWYLARAPAGYRTTQATWDRLNGRMQETAASGRTVHALRLGPRRVALGEDDIRRWLDAERYTLGLRSRFFPVCEAAYVLPLVLAVLVGGLLSIDGHLSIAAVTAAALYAQQLVVPVDTVISQLDTMQLATASLARLLGVSEVPRRAPTDKIPADGVVDVAAARFAYRPDREVLHGLDLSPAPGSTVALVGPSGAGKSTIALLIAGIHAPTGGRVTVGGVDTYRLPSDRLRREVVLVTQEHHVFSGTLRDNLVLAAPGTTDARLVAALEATDCAALLRRLPEGLDTPLGAGGAALSPGEAQRLALTRLVLADPHTLVLDEATALLDPIAARHLERSLHRVLAGRTVIAVAHRLQTARDADTVAVIDGGRVVESGTHDELLAGGGAYARLWPSWRRQGPDEPPPVASET